MKQFIPESVEELSKTQMGNHPVLIKLANRVMKHLDDDDFLAGESSRPVKKERDADVMYDHPSSKAKASGE